MSSHAIWQRVRRPFRYPVCKSGCRWEIYDANQAGCLKCGRHHLCMNNAVDNTCPLVTCDDRTRVCTITGYVLPEVRHAVNEYTDTACITEPSCPAPHDMGAEVYCIVASMLTSDKAARCRTLENTKQYTRLAQHLHKQMRLFKLTHADRLPNVQQLIASSMQQERYWRFIEEASEDLVRHCCTNITACLIELKATGTKITSGVRMQELVCGLLYMLRHGLVFHERILLFAIPEIARCLPHENKIEAYFGISSKVICMTENEVKLVFREKYRP